MSVAFAVLPRTELLSDPRKAPGSRTHSRPRLPHTGALITLPPGAPLLSGASPEREERAATGGSLWGALPSHGRARPWLHTWCPAGRWRPGEREAGPGCLRRTSVSLRSDLVESGSRGLESRRASWVLSIWLWQGGLLLLPGGHYHTADSQAVS